MGQDVSTAAPAERADGRIRPYAWYALFVFVLVYIVNFIDRQILAILVSDIKRDLGVSDAEIGFLYGTAFAIFYSIFGIPLGRLADRWHRGRLMAMGLALWSSMTMVSGLATSFGALAAARVGVGIGEASASPAAYSMIADHFPKRRRATAMSIYASGIYIGGGLSLPIGGTIVSRWSQAFPDPAAAPLGLAGWQAAFIAVGLPGLLLALWVLTLKEPARGRIDGAGLATSQHNAWREFGREIVAILPPLTLFAVARLPGELARNLVALACISAMSALLISATGDVAQWSAYGLGIYAVYSWTQSFKHRDAAAYRLIWGSPVFLILLAVFGGLSAVTYATKFWLPYYAEQTFYPGAMAASVFLDGATAKEEIGNFLGWSSAIASALGVVIGGYASDLWHQRDARGRLFVCMVSALLPVPLVAFLLTTDSLTAFYCAIPLAYMSASAWVGAAVVSLQDLVSPRMRGIAGATYILASTMLGLALGPYLVGRISDLTGSLGTGIAMLYALCPLAVIGLALASSRFAAAEVRAAIEPA